MFAYSLSLAFRLAVIALFSRCYLEKVIRNAAWARGGSGEGWPRVGRAEASLGVLNATRAPPSEDDRKVPCLMAAIGAFNIMMAACVSANSLIVMQNKSTCSCSAPHPPKCKAIRAQLKFKKRDTRHLRCQCVISGRVT